MPTVAPWGLLSRQVPPFAKERDVKKVSFLLLSIGFFLSLFTSFVVAGRWDWVRSQRGNIPIDALIGGEEHSPARQHLFICKAKFRGGVHPGKIRPGFGGCNISWGGSEFSVPNYKVLLSGDYEWIESSGGYIPRNAVQGGARTFARQATPFCMPFFFSRWPAPGQDKTGIWRLQHCLGGA